MSTVTETPARAFAHCRSARCPGNAQEEVDAVRAEQSFTFGDLGGDGVFTHMQERSTVEYRFSDPDEEACPVCAEPRELTGTPRPSYLPLSGHDPMGLLSVPKFNASAQAQRAERVGRGETDEEIEARMRAKIREEQIEARLREEMDE